MTLVSYPLKTPANSNTVHKIRPRFHVTSQRYETRMFRPQALVIYDIRGSDWWTSYTSHKNHLEGSWERIERIKYGGALLPVCSLANHGPLSHYSACASHILDLFSCFDMSYRHVLFSPSPSASEGEVTASEGEVRPWWLCGRGRWER